ncbi:MAG: PQQ-binding-like beta-propeller repeat protein [Rhodospirillaceae bacterium]|nr:PQQ-binding-like beta-propeller repeat protein [Rhodospirillaceae bacterium]
MLRIAFVVLAVCFAGPAEAAYKARLLVPPGPLFNVQSVMDGDAVRADLDLAALEANLAAPGGVAVAGTSAQPRIYVADVLSIREVDAATGALRNVISISDRAYPTTVSHAVFGGRSLLIAASWITGRVLVIDPTSGDVLRDEAGFNQPYDVVGLNDGRILVAEAGAKRIVMLDETGARRALADGFQRPMGLALAGEILYVTDRAAGTLIALNLVTGKQHVAAADLNEPEGVAVLPDQRVAVVATGQRAIVAVDPATGARANIATNLAVGAQNQTQFVPSLGKPADARIFNGLAMGPDSALYLPSDIQTALYVLQPGDGPASFMAMLRGLTSKMFR